jgi:hypothetical protein
MEANDSYGRSGQARQPTKSYGLEGIAAARHQVQDSLVSQLSTPRDIERFDSGRANFVDRERIKWV